MSTLNTNDPQDLLFGSAESVAAYLGVSVKTVKRWKAGAPLPATIERLLRIRYGDLSGLLGADWQGFTFGTDGKLYPPFFRGGFSALQICGMFFEVQELRHLRREVKRLCGDLARERSNGWAAGKVREAVSGKPCRGARSEKR